MRDTLRRCLMFYNDTKYLLRKANVYVFCTKIDYLGYMLSDEGVSVDLKKIEFGLRWPVPKIDAKCFLKLGTYMRKYIRDFANIAARMTDLLQDKFEKITCTNYCHANFEVLEKCFYIISRLEDHRGLERRVRLVHRCKRYSHR